MKSNSNRSAAVVIALWGIVLLLVVLVVVFSLLKKPPEQVEVRKEKAYPVTVLPLAPRSVADVLRLPGRLEAVYDAHLAAEKPGRIVAVTVERGEAVKAGQPLVKIDDRSAADAVHLAEIQVRDAERELARWRELQAVGGVSSNDLDRLVTARDLAAVGLAEARTQLSRCSIAAPVDGIVDERLVEPGEYANEGQAMLRLVSAAVKLVLDVPERDVQRVRVGAALPFRVASVPDATFTGTVSFVAMAGSAQSNAFRVEAGVADPGGLLRAGMIAEASILRQQIDGAIVVPLSAVIPKRGEYIAFVAEEGRAATRYVKFETMAGEECVVTSGLKPGDQLIVEGQRGLQDADLLDVRMPR